LNKALKKKFLSRKVYLGVASSQMKKDKALTLDLKRITTKLKNFFKRETRKAQNKEAKPSWKKR